MRGDDEDESKEHDCSPCDHKEWCEDEGDKHPRALERHGVEDAPVRHHEVHRVGRRFFIACEYAELTDLLADEVDEVDPHDDRSDGDDHIYRMHDFPFCRGSCTITALFILYQINGKKSIPQQG